MNIILQKLFLIRSKQDPQKNKRVFVFTRYPAPFVSYKVLIKKIETYLQPKKLASFANKRRSKRKSFKKEKIKGTIKKKIKKTIKKEKKSKIKKTKVKKEKIKKEEILKKKIFKSKDQKKDRKVN